MNALIINGAKQFAHSNGQLNETLCEVADGFLRDAGHAVQVVRADGDYDITAEVQKFLWAALVIWQMPGWWMGAPWTVKKYMDDVSLPVMATSMQVTAVPAPTMRRNMVLAG